MSRRTRSNTVLPGGIGEYLVDNIVETANRMPDPPPSGDATGADGGEDIHSLLSMMVKTLNKVTESRNEGGYQRLEACPVKRKKSSLDAWISEVLLWDESNVSKLDGWNAKKYLKFVESVRKSEDCSDLQNLVEVEFVENLSFEKKSDDVIKSMINKIKEKL